MDKALLDFEVSIDADCKLLTVGKPFAIEGTTADSHTSVLTVIKRLLETHPLLWMSARMHQERPCSEQLFVLKVQIKRFLGFFSRLKNF